MAMNTGVNRESWVLINKHGDVVDCGENNVYWPFGHVFSDGQCLMSKRREDVVDGKEKYFIPRPGAHTIEWSFKGAEPFLEGLACIEAIVGQERVKIDTDDGIDYQIQPKNKFGFIDPNGKVVIPPQFDFASSFACGVALVYSDKCEYFIDKKGEYVKCLGRIRIQEGDTFRTSDFIDGYAIRPNGDEVTVIDISGRTRLTIKPNLGMYCLTYSGSLMFRYNPRNGAPIFYEAPDPAAKGVLGLPSPIKKRFAIDKSVRSVGDFVDGLALIEPEVSKFGFINKSGSYAIKPLFDKAGNFSEGLAFAYVMGCPVTKEGEKSGYINSEGEWVFDVQIADQNGKLIEYFEFHEGLAKFKMSTPEPNEFRFGFIDKTGAIVIPPIFRSAEEFSEGYCWVIPTNIDSTATVKKSTIGKSDDELFVEAAKITVQTQIGSASTIQRRLKLDYVKATEIIERLTLNGICGPSRGSKPRDVLVAAEDLDELISVGEWRSR